MKTRRVMLLDTEPRTHNYYITLAIADALRRHPSVDRLVLATHADAIRVFQEEGLDTVLAFGGSERHTDLLAKLCGISSLSVLWTTEDPYQLAGNVRTSTCFDIVFTNDRASVPAYEGRAYHLPLAAGSQFQDIPVIENDGDYLYDLLFIGTAWPNRVHSLNKITDALSGVKMKLALPWNEFIGPPDLNQDDLLTDWRCSNRDFARFANSSRIVLTLPRHFSAASDAQAIGSTPPPRLFEAALAGGAQVVVSPDQEVHVYYEPGVELVSCASDEEAIEAIRDLLADPGRRIEMARRARERTLREHLYDHRVDEVLTHAFERGGRWHARSEPKQKETILFVSHNRLGRLPGGGVEIYQEILAHELDDYTVMFMYPGISSGRTVLYLEGPDLFRRFDAATMSSELLTDSDIEQLFERILVEHNIDLVHFHHLLYMPLSLPLIARSFGVPTVWQMHDFYLICDRYNLLTFDNRFCDVVHRGTGQCDACLLSLDNRPAGSKSRRDGFTALVAQSIDSFIASTPFSGTYIRGFFPEILEGAVHVLPLPSTRPINVIVDGQRAGGETRRGLEVAIPGNFTKSKGADYLIAVMRLCTDYDINFHVFGRVEEMFAERLATVGAGRVTIRNGYEAKDIVGLMSGCDISLHLSIWPETFMLSLTETWEAQVVPIVADIGAPGERVEHGVDGFKVPPNDPASAFGFLQRLYFDRAELARMRHSVSLKSFVTPPEHGTAVRLIYADLIERYPVIHSRVPDLTPRVFEFTTFDAGLRLNSSSWISRANLWDGDQTPHHGPTRKMPVARRMELSLDEPGRDIKLSDAAGSLIEAHIDILRIDGEPVAIGEHSVALSEVEVQGWMVEGSRSRPRRTLIRLRGDKVAAVFEMSPEARDDVAGLFGYSAGAALGFKGSISVDALPDGLFVVDIIQVLDVSVAIDSDVFSFTVQSAKSYGQSYPSAWYGAQRRALAEKRHELADELALVVRQNLPVAGNLVIGTGENTWWIQGGGLTAVPDRDLLVARLETASGRAVYETIARPRTSPQEAEGNSDFVVVGNLRDLPPGSYKLQIAHLRDGEALVQPTRLWLYRSKGPGPWSVDALPPDVFNPTPHGSRSVPHAKIDDLLQGAVNMTRVRGWAFCPELGQPTCTVAMWSSAGIARYSICLPLERPDVAASLNNRDAARSGYEVDLPEDSLRQGAVRLFQYYKNESLEYIGFDAALRARGK